MDSENRKYPRVLVLGESFRLTSGGGITLTSLFMGWPSEKVCDVHDITDRDDSVTTNHIFIRPGDFQEEDRCNDNSMKNIVKRVLKGFIGKYIVQSWSRDRIKISRRLIAILEEFQPELIYAQPSVFMVDVILEIKRILAIPLVVHYMDDWVETIRYDRKLLSPWSNNYMQKRFRKLITEADAVLTISELMAIEYKSRYGIEAIAFQNCLNRSEWIRKDRSKLKTAYRILYPGRIGWTMTKTLHNVGRAVERLIAEGMEIEFTILDHPSEISARLLLDSYLEPPVPYRMMKERYEDADLLIIPFDSEKKALSYVCLSMPTKIPEYLALGISVIVAASKETAVAQYAEQEGWGVVVDPDDIDAIAGEIRELCTNLQRREQTTTESSRVFKRYHSQDTVGNNFQNLLISIAQEK